MAKTKAKKILDVSCPACGARPRERCRDFEGRPAKAHEGRQVRAAQEGN